MNERIAELRTLKDGWLDKGSKAPTAEFLDWLEPMMPTGAFAFPTQDGGVSLEWRIGRRDISLDIEPSKKASYHDLDHETDDFESVELDMQLLESWREIERRIAEVPNA